MTRICFLRGSPQKCENLIEVLNEYEKLSGKRVNLAKSAVCFSKNTSIPDQEFLTQILGVGAVGVQDKYLGLPTLIAQSKLATFPFVEERLMARLQGWAQRTLSSEAKETLIKSVASALALHVLSCFKLPLTLCRILVRFVARFLCGVEDGHSRIRWISWRKMCRSKHEGGMGFCMFEHFNQALLAKIGWRILNEPQSLFAQVYKGKYFPTGTYLTSTARYCPSWGWQSIMYDLQLLMKGLRWQIGSRESVSALNESWVPALHQDPRLITLKCFLKVGTLKCWIWCAVVGGGWSNDKLAQWFHPDTCHVIKAIPLPRLVMEDKQIWHATYDEVFTITSSYHLVVQIDKQQGRWSPMVSWMDRQSLIQLWDSSIPPKLKVFLWQPLHRFLPTTEALIEKDVPVHPRWPVCWAKSETMEHLFLECPVARALWDHVGLEHLGQWLPRQTSPLFLKKLLALIHDPH
ncbi:unnamed protein product [Linum trigynum]|uniref:Reverse transcriptase zinc-binding domain-containing protein n=1 Tax=Linum trigynum TaxID=586398 RepID=A0AAV2DXJ6_9ROSI